VDGGSIPSFSETHFRSLGLGRYQAQEFWSAVGRTGERGGAVKVIYKDGILGIILGMDSQTSDGFDDLWELAEYSVREARVLRSFLEYLRLPGDPQDKKLVKIQNWKNEVGLQLGNPQVTDSAGQLFQTLKGLPQELRSALVQQTLADAHSIYFGETK
jgi:hypothetical protein